ncbi:hypothetical protein D3C85_1223070 [compost metagenome]
MADLGDAWNRLLRALDDRVGRSVVGRPFQQNMQGLAEQLPGAAKYEQGHDHRQDRVDRRPTGEGDNDGRSDRADRSQ